MCYSPSSAKRGGCRPAAIGGPANDEAGGDGARDEETGFNLRHEDDALRLSQRGDVRFAHIPLGVLELGEQFDALRVDAEVPSS